MADTGVRPSPVGGTSTTNPTPAAPLTFACQGCRAPLSVGSGAAPALPSSSSAAPRPAAQTPPVDGSFVLLDEAGRRKVRLDESFVVLAGSPAIMRPGGGTRPGPSPSPSTTGPFSPVPHTPLDARFAAVAAALELASSAAGVDAPLCGECAGRVGAELEAAILEAEAEAEAHGAALAALRREGGGPAPAPAPAPPTSPIALAASKAAAAKAAARAAAAAADARAALADLAAARAEAAALDGAEEAYWRDLNAAEAAGARAADARAASAARLARARASLASLRGRDAVADLYRIWHDGPFGTICGLRLGRGSAASAKGGGAGEGEEGAAAPRGGPAPAPLPAPPPPPPSSSSAGPPGWDEVNGALTAAARLLATLAALHGVHFSRVALLLGGAGAKVQELLPGASLPLAPAGPGTGPAAAAFDPPPAPPAPASSAPPPPSPLDLGGPANRLYCPAFDRAVALFAGAVAEFGLAAGLADELAGVAPPFKLPYAIEAATDGAGGIAASLHASAAGPPAPAPPPGTPATTIGGVPLRFALAPASRWTRAMKYLLTDLKWCAAWSAERRAGLGSG